MKKTNLQELTFRVTKSLKNNVAFRVYSKLESVVYNGDFLSTKDFLKSWEGEIFKNPESILVYLELLGIAINEVYLNDNDFNSEIDYWNSIYEKLTFRGGSTAINPLDMIREEYIADKIIYMDWCALSQSLKGNYGKHDIAFKKMIKEWEGKK